MSKLQLNDIIPLAFRYGCLLLLFIYLLQKLKSITMMQYYKNKKRTFTKRKLVVTLCVVAVLAVGAAAWWHKSHSNSKVTRTNDGTAVANPNVPGKSEQKAGSNNSDTNAGTGNSKDKATNTPGAAPKPTVQPTAPTGQFVSNHIPSLSGSPTPNTETSVCATTPGVQCQIKFTSGGVTKALPAKKTDGNGSASWNWKLQDIGLTRGTWTITAVAINGDKTASARDAMNLTVQ